MKKLVIAFLGIFLLLNVACSRDDNDTVSIVGTWNISSVKMKGTLSYNGQSAAINEETPADACSQKSSMVFNADGTGSVTSFANNNGTCEQLLSETFTYKFDGNTKVLTITQAGTTESVTLSFSGSNKFSYGETLNNVNFGDYYPQYDGFYYTGTISTVFVKK
ncbi:hypothetical protein SDC9_01746 [bioreactor metagenome]|jgi:hypothetical protein|uniref:Lipocalin-like domain-containing protein n=1 Tax=bioreactor metagenome TaxID=1076179 RepID=A0A644SRI5_9ZZZZ